MAERDVKSAIRQLTIPGLVIWNNPRGIAVTPGGGRVSYGVGGDGGADLICCYRGRFVAIEVKAPGGRTSPARALAQRQYRELVARHGGVAVEVRSVDDVIAALREIAVPWPPVATTSPAAAAAPASGVPAR